MLTMKMKFRTFTDVKNCGPLKLEFDKNTVREKKYDKNPLKKSNPLSIIASEKTFSIKELKVRIFRKEKKIISLQGHDKHIFFNIWAHCMVFHNFCQTALKEYFQ